MFKKKMKSEVINKKKKILLTQIQELDSKNYEMIKNEFKNILDELQIYIKNRFDNIEEQIKDIKNNKC